MRVPGGGASCLGVGRPGSGALPPPTARPLGGLPGPTTHWLWVRGAAGVGTRHQPHSARSCELALRAVGAARGRSGGAPPAWVWGVWGRALSHPRLPALWAGWRGPLPTCCGCGGVRAWGPVTNPTARALASWLCALWGPQEGARGGRLLPGCGASGAGRSAIPDCPPSGRVAGAHYPLAVGAGGCGLGDPSPTPQRALLRAGFARCGGGTRAPGGAPPAWVWGVRGRALPHCRLPDLWAGCRGPLATGCWSGGVRAWGPVTNPTACWLCALWGRHDSARGEGLLPGCGASGVGRSPSHDCPPSWRAAGAHYPLAVGAGGVRAWGHVTNFTARALASWLCALWGRHEDARGRRLLPGCGASGVGRSPSPDCPPSGRAAGAHYPLAVVVGGCGRGDPSPTPQRAGFARCGGGMRVPGGGPPLPGCGASGVGRSPTPDCPPSVRAAGAHYPLAVGAGGCGRGDLSPTPQRAGFARCGGGMIVPGGGGPLPRCGASGVGRSPTPNCPPSVRAAGAHYPLAVVVGGFGGGDPSPTPQRAGFARCGGGMRVPGGGAPCLGVGRPGSGALPLPTARPLGGLPGPTTHWLWVLGGAGVRTRHQPHSALALRAVGAA